MGKKQINKDFAVLGIQLLSDIQYEVHKEQLWMSMELYFRNLMFSVGIIIEDWIDVSDSHGNESFLVEYYSTISISMEISECLF